MLNSLRRSLARLLSPPAPAPGKQLPGEEGRPRGLVFQLVVTPGLLTVEAGWEEGVGFDLVLQAAEALHALQSGRLRGALAEALGAAGEAYAEGWVGESLLEELGELEGAGGAGPARGPLVPPTQAFRAAEGRKE